VPGFGNAWVGDELRFFAQDHPAAKIYARIWNIWPGFGLELK
jgi:hypothetical protein